MVVADGLGGPPADELDPLAGLVPAALDHPHLAAWRDAFRAFGAKRHRCSGWPDAGLDACVCS